MLQTLFACLITLQFVVVVSHDLVDIPGWTHGSQVQSLIGRPKLWLVTVINGIFPGIAAAFAIYFWNRPKPGYVATYWVIYCAVTLASAIAMWYIPYFLGATEDRKRQYSAMYAGTKQALPRRGDNPRPNLLHVCFHALFVLNFALVLFLRFGPLLTK
ncbi:MAG TPA: hypothetical protein VNY05_39850 [Candidatus Acidoferrales bacterium]|jgi:hypothetical protein|nr:hypothetical protein [Candidatus Acidoferrales bacterium]